MRARLAGGSPGPESLTATSTPSDSALLVLIGSSRDPVPDLAHRFNGVHDQVQDHLLQLDFVPQNVRQSLCQLHLRQNAIV